MSSSAGFLEFFILEASEYVEELDGLLLGGGAAGPNGDAVQRTARALRGTATMAKLPAFADLAAGVERVGRALHSGALAWEPGLHAALVAAVDDLKLLLHAARTWSPAEARRAAERTAELARFAPAGQAVATPARSRAHSFLSTEAANIAAGLELLTTRPGDPETAANVLRRVRALRGVAAVIEVAPLADVLEATEDATRGLELDGEPLSPDGVALLTAAALLLRRVAVVLRDGIDPNAATGERERFTAAYDGWSERLIQRQRVVPIAELFYADGSTGLVDEAKSPPTSMAERFRLELVSQGEHLRGAVSASRAASDPASSGRARRVLRRALRSIEATADSFGHSKIGEHVRGYAPAADRLDAADLASLEELAHRLSEPGANGERVLAAASRARSIGEPTPVRSAPTAPPMIRKPAHDGHTTPSLDVLNASIVALESMSAQPFSEPLLLGDEPIVPIEQLVYRGRAALRRAVEIRDELRERGTAPDAESLEELFDLLELAQTE